MALYNAPPEPRVTVDDERGPERYNWLPWAAAAIAAVLLMAVVFPHSFGIAGINPRPSMQTVTKPATENAVVAPMSSPAQRPIR